jgi:hypothetical protein
MPPTVDMDTANTPLTISSFTILPLTLPSPPSLAHLPPATHYLYIQPHAPKLPDPDTPRAIFLANIPILTTEAYLKHLFTVQLTKGAARVERVEFPGAVGHGSTGGGGENKVVEGGLGVGGKDKKSKKRKRGAGVEELEAQLKRASWLPSTGPPILHASGAHALVYFVDRAAAELAMKGVRKAVKAQRKIIWGEGLDSEKKAATGSARYLERQRARYPEKEELLRGVNRYMSTFRELEEARRKEGRGRESRVDEEGFVTVVRGPKAIKVGEKSGGEEGEGKGVEKEKGKTKGEGLGDFYRFQMREKRKEREGELRRGFERDRERVAEMRRVRGRVRPE